MIAFLKAFLELSMYNRRTGSTSKLLSGFKDSEFYFITGTEVNGIKNVQSLARKHPELGIDKDNVKVLSISGNMTHANFRTGKKQLPIAIDVHAMRTIAQMAIQELEKNRQEIWNLKIAIKLHEAEKHRLKEALDSTLYHNKEWVDWSTSGGLEWYTRSLYDAAIQVIKRKEFYRHMRLNPQLKALKYGRTQHFDYKYVKMAKDRSYRKFIKP